MKTKLHFAGLNQESSARGLEGQDVLISYADIIRRPGVWARDILPRLEAGAYGDVILDSGAFTVISAGISIDAHEYGRFIEQYGHLFDRIINLDSIAGCIPTTHRNQLTLEGYANGQQIVPVFHQGEDWEILEGYLADHDFICVGFARKPGGKLVGGCQAFLDEFFARLQGRAQVHGLAMTKWAASGYDFYSVDSTTWISEKCALARRSFEGGHGAIGTLGEVLDAIGKEGFFKLTIASYENGVVKGDKWTAEAKGQADTVLRRLGEARFNELAAALAA